MSTKPPRPAWQVGVLVIVAVGGVLAGSLLGRQWLATGRVGAKPVTRAAAVYDTPRPLPDFRLTDEAGHEATAQSLHGRWTFLFFGYTHCPDVCPATLAQLGQVSRALADLPAAQQPAVYLVSVDPARDTASRLAEYVHYFNPVFHALAGESEAVGAFTRALGIAVIVRQDGAADYTVDHTAAILLVDPNGAVAAVFPAPHVVDTVAADYRLIVASRPDVRAR